MANESLSALFDGECSPEEMDRLLDEMEREPEMKAAWSRMCVAREAREGTRVKRDQPCICADVMSRLDAAPEPMGSNVVDLAARQPAPAKPRRSFDWRALSGWAVAASVAVVAVTLNFGGNGRESMDAAGSSALPQVSSPVSVPLPTRRPRNLQTVSLSPDEQAMDEDLRNYLIEHSNTLAERGMGGTLSYARFAAYNVDQAPSQAQAQPAVVTTGAQR